MDLFLVGPIVMALPHLALPHPALPHPALPHPALPHPALPHPALPHPALPHLLPLRAAHLPCLRVTTAVADP